MKFDHHLPIVDLHLRDFASDIGPARFWNAEEPVITHLFNAIIYTDKYTIEHDLEVVQAWLSMNDREGDSDLFERIQAYQDQLLLSQKHNQDHIDTLTEMGYEDRVAPLFEKNRATRRAMDPEQFVRVHAPHFNAYSWMSKMVGGFLLDRHWFLSMAAQKPAIMFRWRMIVDNIHANASYALCESMQVGFLERTSAFVRCSHLSEYAFTKQFLYMLRKDECFARADVIDTLKRIFAIFFRPSGGFYWANWSYLIRFIRHSGNADRLDQRAHIADFLLNYRQYIEQLNPNVDDTKFYSATFLQDGIGSLKKRDA